jgi:hypothetical protein
MDQWEIREVLTVWNAENACEQRPSRANRAEICPREFPSHALLK